MKRLAFIAAVRLVAFSACKKNEPEQVQQPQEENKYPTAEFSVEVGLGFNGEVVAGYYDVEENHLSVIVTNQSSNASTYLWEWGDNESDYGVDCFPRRGDIVPDHPESRYLKDGGCYNSHLYREAGTYTITLTVANGEGLTDCKSKTITLI